ncbi:MAG TPA: hypothetical protein PKD15_05075, partial [Candidatus Saccharibacteria bacterium]|nr:hypothetical protein [Candidatus Saccharibacteria bacterium]
MDDEQQDPITDDSQGGIVIEPTEDTGVTSDGEDPIMYATGSPIEEEGVSTGSEDTPTSGGSGEWTEPTDAEGNPMSGGSGEWTEDDGGTPPPVPGNSGEPGDSGIPVPISSPGEEEGGVLGDSTDEPTAQPTPRPQQGAGAGGSGSGGNIPPMMGNGGQGGGFGSGSGGGVPTPNSGGQQPSHDDE